MSQVELKYNANDPEGQWRLIRDDVSAPDVDLVATQTRPTDELALGVRPPGPQQFQGLRVYAEFYADSAPETVIPGGSWDMQLIESAILPADEFGVNPIRILGGEVVTGLPSLSVILAGGWRDGAISIRLAAITFPGGANRARVYIREF